MNQNDKKSKRSVGKRRINEGQESGRNSLLNSGSAHMLLEYKTLGLKSV